LHFPTLDTGTVRGDLRALARAIVAAQRDPVIGGLLHDGFAGFQESPELREAALILFRLRRVECRKALERGVARGELAAGADFEVTFDALTGPLYFRLLLYGEAPDDAFADAVADAVVKAFRPG
jgi:Tetracyclin repressor-like, C-terminal domain